MHLASVARHQDRGSGARRSVPRTVVVVRRARPRSRPGRAWSPTSRPHPAQGVRGGRVDVGPGQRRSRSPSPKRRRCPADRSGRRPDARRDERSRRSPPPRPGRERRRSAGSGRAGARCRSARPAAPGRRRGRRRRRRRTGRSRCRRARRSCGPLAHGPALHHPARIEAATTGSSPGRAAGWRTRRRTAARPSRPSASTSCTSGGHSSRSSSPRPSRLITESCSVGAEDPSTVRSSADDVVPGLPPAAVSACRPRSARLIGIPIRCSTRRRIGDPGRSTVTVTSRPGPARTAATHVPVAGHGRATHHVDLRALGVERVLDEDRQGVVVDLLVLVVAVRVLQHVDVGDLAALTVISTWTGPQRVCATSPV